MKAELIGKFLKITPETDEEELALCEWDDNFGIDSRSKSDVFIDNLEEIKDTKEVKEFHQQGFLSVEEPFPSMVDCDFGLQVANDGRVWVCINSQAFIRFKPACKNKKGSQE